MMLRLVLFGMVAALGVSIPSQPGCEHWYGSCRRGRPLYWRNGIAGSRLTPTVDLASSEDRITQFARNAGSRGCGWR